MSNGQIAEASVEYSATAMEGGSAGNAGAISGQGEGVAVGYKMTEVGVVPEDWEIKSGEEVTTLIGKGASPRWQGFGYTNSGMLFVTSENVRDGYLDISEPKYLPLEFHEKIKRSKLQKGDILINLVGASIGRSCRIEKDLGEANINQAVSVFRVSEKYNSKYIACYFSSPICVDRILGMQVDAARPNISLGDLRQFLIPLPSEQEQTAIANALSDVDALINGLEKLITKKQAIKTATMQQLLTGRTRLPQFALREDGTPKGYNPSELGEVPEDWVTPSVLELVRNIVDYRGRTPRKMGMEWGGGNIVALSAGNVKKGYIDFDAESYLGSEELYKRWMTSGHPENGDIVFTMEAPLGNVALIPDSKKYILSQRTILLQINRQKYNPYLIFQILMSDSFQAYIADSATGSTAQGIKRTTFEKLRLALSADISEQTSIATILSDMDEEIQTLQQRLSKTRQIKQGMMQELLTGRTRLV